MRDRESDRLLGRTSRRHAVVRRRNRDGATFRWPTDRRHALHCGTLRREPRTACDIYVATSRRHASQHPAPEAAYGAKSKPKLVNRMLLIMNPGLLIWFRIGHPGPIVNLVLQSVNLGSLLLK